METRKTVLGPEHPSTLASMNNLASTYQDQGRWNEAEKLNVQVMEIRKTMLGPEHPDTLVSMNNLAYTWESQGKLHDALALMEKCCKLCSKVLGPNHLRTRSFSRALSDWMDKYNPLPTQPSPAALTQSGCSQHLQEISVESTAAVVTAQLLCEEHINLSHTQRRSNAKLFLRNHPLIIASRAGSPAPGNQHLQEVD